MLQVTIYVANMTRILYDRAFSAVVIHSMTLSMPKLSAAGSGHVKLCVMVVIAVVAPLTRSYKYCETKQDCGESGNETVHDVARAFKFGGSPHGCSSKCEFVMLTPPWRLDSLQSHMQKMRIRAHEHGALASREV